MNYLLNNIPKIVYLYWDGENKLSFLQYLTVKTFRDLNPDWTIKIYIPTKPYKTITWKSNEQKIKYEGKDYFNKLNECNVEIIKIDFEEIGFYNDVSEVIKSDYIRYYLLGNFGGCWIDFDILFIRPINEINLNDFVTIGNNNNINTVIAYSDKNYYPIGFLMSSKNNSFYLNLLNNCKKYLNLDSYQSIGSYMIKKIYNNPSYINKLHTDINLIIFPFETYLPFEYNQLDGIFKYNNQEKITKNTIGIHWFNGSNLSKEIQNNFDKFINEKSGALFLYIDKYLHLN